MAENYKILYEQMKKMVEKYQDDIVPGLRRDIDRLEAERQWISVEDRLPEPSTYVLVLTAPGTLSLGQNFVVADYIHAKQEKHGMFIKAYSGYSDDDILNVTLDAAAGSAAEGGIMINIDLRDPHIVENTKAIMELKSIGIFSDDELQDMYDRQVISGREEDDFVSV